MIYLRRVSTDNRGNVITDIEELEDSERLELFLSKGYGIVTKDEYRAAWREKDKRTILQPVAQPQPQRERTAGDPYPLPSEPNLPIGYKMFHVKKES